MVIVADSCEARLVMGLNAAICLKMNHHVTIIVIVLVCMALEYKKSSLENQGSL